MNDLHIDSTASTPEIHTDFASGKLAMAGDSYPENSFEFFAAIIQWTQDFLAQQSHALAIEFRLVYMNTSSVKAMLDIFDMLEEAHQNGREIAVRWYYDPRNERVMDLADEFREDCTFSFEIIPEEPVK
ncbi:MAG: biofilm regulation phosphoprotein SiaC [Wenzhouxiangellaceae bacterium]|nr:biofilm regulation phosphoprotein SiaC [Wenzhouxiangellaceae bacterium]